MHGPRPGGREAGVGHTALAAQPALGLFLRVHTACSRCTSHLRRGRCGGLGPAPPLLPLPSPGTQTLHPISAPETNRGASLSCFFGVRAPLT